MELAAKFLKASKVKIKRTPSTRTYGIRARCDGQTMPVMAGEVGEIKFRKITGIDWSQMLLVAEFPHNRELVIGEMVDQDEYPLSEGGTFRVSITLGDDIADIVPIKNNSQ